MYSHLMWQTPSAITAFKNNLAVAGKGKCAFSDPAILLLSGFLMFLAGTQSKKYILHHDQKCTYIKLELNLYVYGTLTLSTLFQFFLF